MSHPVNTEILENLYEEILDDLTAKNIQLGIMLPMEHLEAIAEKHAKKRFEDMCQYTKWHTVPLFWGTSHYNNSITNIQKLLFIMSGIYGSNKKGLNIQVTDSQYDFLYDLIMSAYDLDVPDQKDWDMQTFDNLVDNVCNAKQTYLTNDVKGV